MITSSQTLVESSLECLRSKKAEEIVVMNLSKASDIADYFIVCTGGSDLHVRAIADAVVEGLEEQGVHVWHVEGYEGGRWVLIDLVDVVVHIFQAVTRSFYGLERLWGDATIEFEEGGITDASLRAGGEESHKRGADTL